MDLVYCSLGASGAYQLKKTKKLNTWYLYGLYEQPNHGDNRRVYSFRARPENIAKEANRWHLPRAAR